MQNVTDFSKALTTASFRVTNKQKAWVEGEAKRRTVAEGQKVDQSQILREAIDVAMQASGVEDAHDERRAA